MGQYIVLGLNILLAVFVVFGVISGLIRGLRKTASRGIFLILTSILLLFITIPITSSLLTIKINTDITIGESTLTGQMSIEEIVAFFVKTFLGNDFSNQNPEFVKVITTLPLVFINALVYLILFWLCKYLLLPLNYLFYKLTFAPRKPKENLGFSSFGENENNDSQVPLDQSNQDSNSQTPQDNQAFQTQIDQTNTENQTPDPDQSEMNYTQESVQFKNLKQENLTATQNIFGNEGTFIKKEIEPQDTDAPKFDFRDNETTEVTNPKPAKKQKPKKQKIKYKKHRLWGALVGGCVGLFVMLNTLIPVYGFMGVLKDVNTVKLQNIEEETIDIEQKTNGVTTEIIDSYEKSILKPVSKYLGLEGLGLAEFDYLTTQKVNDKNVTLRKDIQNIVKTVKSADELVGKYKFYTSGGNLSSLTQEQMATLIGDTQNLLATAQKVNLVDCVSEYLIPVACTLIVNSDTKLSDNQIVNRLMIDAIKSLAESKGISVFDESTALLDLAEYLNNQGLLVRILQNNFDKPIEIIQGLDNDFGTQFTTRLFKLKTVNLTMPYLLNIGLNFLENALNIDYSEVEHNQENLKQSFSSLVNESVTMIKTLDTSSSIYLTNQSLIPLGELLDTIKSSGLIDSTTYYKLIDYAIDKITDLLDGLVPDEFNNFTKNELIKNIRYVDNWEVEMTKINTVVKKLRDKQNGFLGEIVESETLRQGTNIDTIVFSEAVFGNLGECLDILDSTCLFKTTTKNSNDGNPHSVAGTISLFASVLDYANNDILGKSDLSSLQQISTVFDKMKDNLIKSNHIYETDRIFWKDELTKIAPLINEIYDMVDTSEFEISDNFGKNLDKAKGTTMFGNGVTLDLMAVAVDAISEIILPDNFEYNDGSSISPQNINDVMYEMFDQIKANLDSNDQNALNAVKQAGYWQTEMTYMQTLQRIAEKSSDLQDIQKAKDLAGDLDSLVSSKIIPNHKIYKLVAIAIKEAKDTTTTDAIELKINDVIEDISQNLLTIAGKVESKEPIITNTTFDESIQDFWQIEFEHITNLTDIDFSGENVVDDLGNIGKTLDTVVYGNTGTNIRASLLITEPQIRDLLATGIDTMSQDIMTNFSGDIKTAVNNALTGIITNIGDTTNITNIYFERELTNLKGLSKLEITESMLKYPTKNDGETDADYSQRVTENQTENQTKLKALGESLDSIAYNTSGDDTNGYSYITTYSNTTSNSKIITRQILTRLIKDIFESMKISDSDLSTKENKKTTQEAFNGLIESIVTEMNNTINADKVMSWKRELGYVNKLVALNKDVTYTISNVAEEVGKNLDGIAFITNANDTAFVDFENKTTGESVKNPSDADGNSLFITRSAIKDMMTKFLSTVKEDANNGTDLEKEQHGIINGLIDNSVTKIANTNNDLSLNTDTDSYNNVYTGFQASLGDLNNIKEDLDKKLDSVKSADAIATETDLAGNIDELLQVTQSKPVSGIVLTRRMARLILNKLNLSGVEPPYYSNLLNYYDTNINKETAEDYSTGTNYNDLNTTDFNDPFRSLKKSLPSV